MTLSAINRKSISVMDVHCRNTVSNYRVLKYCVGMFIVHYLFQILNG